MRAAWLGVLAACSIPDKHPGGPSDGSIDTPGATIDAPPAYACHGQPFPTTAPATLTFAGTVTRTDNSPVPDVVMSLIQPQSGQAALSLTTDASGKYSGQVQTGGAALDVYYSFVPQDPALVPYYSYASAPITADDPNGGAVAYSTTEIGSLYSSAGLAQATSSAMMVLEVVDCTGQFVAGATLQATGGGTLYYYLTTGISTTATTTDAQGVALVFNQPAGMATVTATVPGAGQLRSYTINVVANSFTGQLIQP